MSDGTYRNPDAKSLLDAANSASEKTAVLHLAFMALCAYLLVIVFGTTHRDLLIGKGIKLPIVDVQVPLVGFYATAPFLLVLTHFNLLLQLQTLSRKLYSIDFTASLRDQLHIFPFTQYLVGRSGPVVRVLLGLMVIITLVLLPLSALLAIQVKFLAYQSVPITWAQRTAVWLDTGLLFVLWPLILHPKDDWRDYWGQIITVYIPTWRSQLALLLAACGLVIILFAASREVFMAGVAAALLAPIVAGICTRTDQARDTFHIRLFMTLTIFFGLLFTILVLIHFSIPVEDDSAFEMLSKIEYVEPLILAGMLLSMLIALFWRVRAPLGSSVLLAVLFLVPLLSLSLVVYGEGPFASTSRLQKNPESVLSVYLLEQRRISLAQQELTAKPIGPETLALIKQDKWQDALNRIEPLNLEGRSLRGADFSFAMLLGANLQKAQLQGANLLDAKLQGANLVRAELQGTNLISAHLEKANLSFASLRGADLSKARLQGANLCGAKLQGAELQNAELEGADLSLAWLLMAHLNGARLQGAQLSLAHLEGADLSRVWLTGANLYRARLQGANLTGAQLQGASLPYAHLQGAELKSAKLDETILYHASLCRTSLPEDTSLVDARDLDTVPMEKGEMGTLIAEFKSIPFYPYTFYPHIDEPFSRVLAPLIERISRLDHCEEFKATWESCFANGENAPDGSGLRCLKRFNPERLESEDNFRKRLHAILASLACQSPEIAREMLSQSEEAESRDDSVSDCYVSRLGLIAALRGRLLSEERCQGLKGLNDQERQEILDSTITQESPMIPQSSHSSLP